MCVCVCVCKFQRKSKGVCLRSSHVREIADITSLHVWKGGAACRPRGQWLRESRSYHRQGSCTHHPRALPAAPRQSLCCACQHCPLGHLVNCSRRLGRRHQVCVPRPSRPSALGCPLDAAEPALVARPSAYHTPSGCLDAIVSTDVHGLSLTRQTHKQRSVVRLLRGESWRTDLRSLFQPACLPQRLGGDLKLADEMAWAGDNRHAVPTNT